MARTLFLSAGAILLAFTSVYVLTAQKTTTLPMHIPEITTIGVSHQHRPINAYTFGTTGPHIVFVGGIHGGYEANTIKLAYQLIHHLQHDAEMPENIRVTIIPAANPDGLHMVTSAMGTHAGMSTEKELWEQSRFNGRNVDLNRNFACNWAPESMWGGEKSECGYTCILGE